MDLDTPATNGLVKSIVVNNNLTIILIPNLDAEGIIPARTIIYGPNHELEQLPIGRSITIDLIGLQVLKMLVLPLLG